MEVILPSPQLVLPLVKSPQISLQIVTEQAGVKTTTIINFTNPTLILREGKYWLDKNSQGGSFSLAYDAINHRIFKSII